MKKADTNTWLRFLRNERGAVILFFAAFLPILVAFTAFVVDMSYAYSRKGGMQAAADAAAMAGAMEISFQNPSGLAKGSTGYEAILTKAINQSYGTLSYSGYVNGHTDSSRTVEVDPPTVDDVNFPFTVAVSFREIRVFSILGAAYRIFGTNYTSTVISATARARALNAGDNCIISLSNSGAGSISAGGSLTLGTPNGCGIADNSTDKCALSTTGTSAVINVPVNLVGGNCATGSPPPLNISYGYPTPDPYALNGVSQALTNYISSETQGAASTYSTCTGSGSTKSCTLSAPPAGTSLGDMKSWPNPSVGSQGTLTLTGGTYVFDSLNIGAGQTIKSASGTYSTVIVESGILNVAAGGTVDIHAPPTGTFAGVAFACIKSCTAVYFSGGPDFKGAIYAPNASVSLSGNPSSACIQIIASTFTMSGNVTLNDQCPEIPTRSSRFAVRLIQ